MAANDTFKVNIPFNGSATIDHPKVCSISVTKNGGSTWIYKYMVVVNVRGSCKLLFTDKTGDTYSLSCSNGRHTVSYNSKDPTICLVTVQ